MSVNRVQPNVVAGFRFPQPPKLGGRNAIGRDAVPESQQPSAAVSSPTVSGTQSTGVSAPPPGTDPALWDILTADERAFFARLGAMGPLTYGRALQSAAPSTLPIPRGTRLDIRG
jgi:hypothetical protein